jgi:hypothetical protein
MFAKARQSEIQLALIGAVFAAPAAAMTWFGQMTVEGSWDIAIQAVRHLVFFPLMVYWACVLGWRENKSALFGAIMASGCLNALSDFRSVATTPVIYLGPEIGMTGQSSRKYLAWFNNEKILRATTIQASSFGLAIIGFTYFIALTKQIKFACIASLAGYILLGLYTGTRGSTLAVLGAWGIGLLLSGKGFISRFWKLCFLSIGILLGVVSVIWFAGDSARIDRFLGMTSEDRTLTGRDLIWQEAIVDVPQNPLGVGMSRWLGDTGLSEHQTFIQVFRVYGWVPGVFYILVWAILGFLLMLLLIERRMNLLAAMGGCSLAALGLACIESLAARGQIAYIVPFLAIGIIQASKNSRIAISDSYNGNLLSESNDDEEYVQDQILARGEPHPR